MANNNNIDRNNTDNILWRGTVIYGYPKSSQKHLTCNMINNIAQRHNRPNWLIFGDLNITTANHEN